MFQELHIRIARQFSLSQVTSESAQTEQAQAWLQKYESLCQGKAVCRLVDCMGRAIQSPLVELHDRMTLATKPDIPLA